MYLSLALTLPPVAVRQHHGTASPTPTPGPAATVTNGWAGIPETTSGTPNSSQITFVHYLSNDTTNARVGISTASNMASPTYTSYADSTLKTVRHSITGLAENTTYYYQCETAGSLVGTIRHFKTPTQYGAHTFKFAYSCCQSGENKGTVLAGLLGLSPEFWLQTGDAYYPNSYSTAEADYDAYNYNIWMAGTYAGPMFVNMAVGYMYDDHDSILNNTSELSAQDTGARFTTPANPFGANVYDGLLTPTTLASPYWTTVTNVFRRRQPVDTFPVAHATGQNSWAFTRGRVRFLMIDTRSRKRRGYVLTGSAGAQTAVTQITVSGTSSSLSTGKFPVVGASVYCDAGTVPAGTVVTSVVQKGASGNSYTWIVNVSNTVTIPASGTVYGISQQVGAAQLAWIQSELATAAAAGQFMCFMFPNGWEHIGWQDNYDGTSAGFATEQQAWCDSIVSTGMNGRCFMLCGDLHSSQHDSGINTDYSTNGGLRMPHFRCSAGDATLKVINQDADFDLFDEDGANLKQSVGAIVTITDTGGSTITVNVDCYNSDDIAPPSSNFAKSTPASVSVTLGNANPQPMSRSVQIVQTARYMTGNGNSTGQTLTATFASAPTAGNLIIALYGHNSTGTPVPGTLTGWTAWGTVSGSAQQWSRVYAKYAGVSEPQTQTLGATGSITGGSIYFVELYSPTGWPVSVLNALDAQGLDAYAGADRSSLSATFTTTRANQPFLAYALLDRASTSSAQPRCDGGPGYLSAWTGGASVTQFQKIGQNGLLGGNASQRPGPISLAAGDCGASGSVTVGYAIPANIYNQGSLDANTARMSLRVLALNPT